MIEDKRPKSVGEALKTEFLERFKVSNNQLANAIGVHRNTVSNILNDKTSLTPNLACRLAAALGTKPEYWLNIQHSINIWESRTTFPEIKKSVNQLITIGNANA